MRLVRCRQLLGFLLLCSSFLLVAAEDDEEKAPPEKGQGCANLDSIDENLFVNPCDPLITQEIPVNAFDITMYAAFPPYTSGFFAPVAFALVNLLNVALPQYDLRMPLGGDGLLEFLQPFLPSNPNFPDVIAKVTLINAGVDNIRQTARSWWWEYRFVFGCEYGTAIANRTEGNPITNIQLKQSIQDDMIREIQILGYVLQSFAIHENSRRILGLALDDPRVTDPPFYFPRPEERLDGGIRVPQTPPLPPTITSIQPWDHWRQVVGIILWGFIVITGVTVTHLAGIRHRQRSKVNLTTPDGVEALLDVHWRKYPDDTYHLYYRSKPFGRPPTIEEEQENYSEEQHLMGQSGSTEFA